MDKLYKDTLSKCIPFLVERKFTYPNPEKRDGTFESKYNLYNTRNPLIKKKYNSIKQPDDYLKDNVVNVFTNNLMENMKDYIKETETLSAQEAIKGTLKEYDRNTNKLKGRYNKDIMVLNNDIHKKYVNYQSNYYNMNKNKTIMKLILYTIMVFVIIMIFRGMTGIVPMNLILIINVVIMGVYMIYLFNEIKILVEGHMYGDWDKRNWNEEGIREEV